MSEQPVTVPTAPEPQRPGVSAELGPSEQDLVWLRSTTPLVVAIDGPSGSGKSSVSKEVARCAYLRYLDTGAMYRALTWSCLDQEQDLQDQAGIERIARSLALDISTDPDQQYVRVGGVDVTEAIREPRISMAVSAIATTQSAREILITRQRELIVSSGHRIVVEGRDITTVVAPDARSRILLTASEQARMRRRSLELGGSQSAEQVREQVVARDRKDSAAAEFMSASDGVTSIDSSELDFAQTVNAVLRAVLSTR